MHSIGPARRFAVLLLLGGGVVGAQSTLPATNPTVLPAATRPAAPQASAAAAAGTEHRAQVVYAGGQLEITADNSSLNQILREISRQAGMKITGGVKDERVFGKYGPGPAAEILASLLDGTGSNMLLRETPAKAPAELILTVRLGGPTPPNPNAPGLDDDQPAREDEEPREAAAPPAPPAEAGTAATPPAGANGSAGPAAGSAPPTTGAASATAPGAPQTPQEIFQQLQRLQQAQPQPANPQ
jgi:hypothetical protein